MGRNVLYPHPLFYYMQSISKKLFSYPDKYHRTVTILPASKKTPVKRSVKQSNVALTTVTVGELDSSSLEACDHRRVYLIHRSLAKRTSVKWCHSITELVPRSGTPFLRTWAHPQRQAPSIQVSPGHEQSIVSCSGLIAQITIHCRKNLDKASRHVVTIPTDGSPLGSSILNEMKDGNPSQTLRSEPIGQEAILLTT